MTLVAGVDSWTQSCKVLVCDATTGRVVREGHAGHPPGTEIAPPADEYTADPSPEVLAHYAQVRDLTEGIVGDE